MKTERSDNLFPQDDSEHEGPQEPARSPSPEIDRPPVPDTGWAAPEYVDFSDAEVIGLDCETYDPKLIDYGPGWARESGYLMGVSLSDGKRSAYFPLRHPDSDNMPAGEVLEYVGETIQGKTIVGANLSYDFGWLTASGLRWSPGAVRRKIWDCQYAEAVLLPGQKINLDTLAKRYLGPSSGKATETLYRWLENWHGMPARKSPRAFLYTAPAALVGPYAEEDAALPVRIYKRQLKRARKVDRFEWLIRAECSLIPLYLRMRAQGVAVDIPQAAKVEGMLAERAAAAQKELNREAGFRINVNARTDLERLWTQNRWPIAKTESGAASFTREVLESSDLPVAKKIAEIRRYEKIRSTFVENYLLKAAVGGRIYAQFHPLPSHGKGAVTGRFSSSNPNLQNIPARDKELAPLVRGLFVPFDRKRHLWHRFDYDQIEYRLLAHFAEGKGAEKLRLRYQTEPDVDYHTAVQEMVREQTGKVIGRKPIKGLNFGLLYGMGRKKLARMLQLSAREAREMFDAYHKAAPYASATADAYERLAAQQGYITTLMGRKRPLMRDYSYKALNTLLQGSAADIIKMFLYRAENTGMFTGDFVPTTLVHDEVNFSLPDNEQGWAFARQIKTRMADAANLRVPVAVSHEVGKDWGHTEPYTGEYPSGPDLFAHPS